jgi:hypothetical protein
MIDSDNNGADLPAQIRDYFQQRANHRIAIQRQVYVWQKDLMACLNMRWILIHFAVHGQRPLWNRWQPAAQGGNNNVQQAAVPVAH